MCKPNVTGISYIEGGRTVSGFYSVEECEHPVRLYRVSIRNNTIKLDPVSKYLVYKFILTKTVGLVLKSSNICYIPQALNPIKVANISSNLLPLLRPHPMVKWCHKINFFCILQCILTYIAWNPVKLY